MVFPLLVMALAWDKFRLGERCLHLARPVRLRLAGRTLVTSTLNVAVATGFTVMAGFVFYLAGAGKITGGPGFQVFIGAMATYILLRQALLGLRAEPRRWSLGRPVTLIAAVAALSADILSWVPR